MSGSTSSAPGRSGPGKVTPQSTTSHSRWSLGAVAVHGEVHADLAHAAQRQEDELVLLSCGHCLARLPVAEEVAGRNASTPAPSARSSQPPRRCLQNSRRPRSAEVDTDRRADALGGGPPVGADRREALARPPLFERIGHSLDQAGNSARRHCHAQRRRSVVG